MKLLAKVLILILIIGCQSPGTSKKSFLESIENKYLNQEITEDHHYRLRVFHKYMNDNGRLNELEGLSLLSIQDKYNHFIKQKGRKNSHELAHKDFLVKSNKQIRKDSINYILEYENRTKKTVENMKIAINTFDMTGELYQTSTWECKGSNCLNGFKAKLGSEVLELGMKIRPNDLKIYGLKTGEELNLSRFAVSGIEVNYSDKSQTKIGNI